MSETYEKKGNGYSITVVSLDQEAIKTLKKITRDGLKAVGKILREDLKKRTPVRSGRFKKYVGSAISFSKGNPHLKIGFFSHKTAKKRNKKYAYINPYWIEEGVQPHSLAKGYRMRDNPNAKLKKNKHYHKGTKPQKIIRATMEENAMIVKRYQEEYAQKFDEEFVKIASVNLNEEDEEIND